MDYIVINTSAMRVTFKAHLIPQAIIDIARAEHEPRYRLEFGSFDETEAPLNLDREVEISVGLPTLLSLAGSILGKDLIEDDFGK